MVQLYTDWSYIQSTRHTRTQKLRSNEAQESNVDKTVVSCMHECPFFYNAAKKKERKRNQRQRETVDAKESK